MFELGESFNIYLNNFEVDLVDFLNKKSSQTEVDSKKIYPTKKNIITGQLINSILGTNNKVKEGYKLELKARARSKKNFDYAPIQEFGSKSSNPRKIKAGEFLNDSWINNIGDSAKYLGSNFEYVNVNDNLENEILDIMLKDWAK